MVAIRFCVAVDGILAIGGNNSLCPTQAGRHRTRTELVATSLTERIGHTESQHVQIRAKVLVLARSSRRAGSGACQGVLVRAEKSLVGLGLRDEINGAKQFL